MFVANKSKNIYEMRLKCIQFIIHSYSNTFNMFSGNCISKIAPEKSYIFFGKSRKTPNCFCTIFLKKVLKKSRNYEH